MRVPLIDLQAQHRVIAAEIGAAIGRVLERQRFILGEEVAAFESEMAAYCETKEAVGCASGTDAILLSLLALGIEKGDEVITTAYSFFSTAGMIAWIKARPVFVDIDPQTMNIDTEQVESRISAKTKAILAVDLFGQCASMERLKRTGLPVIEDAAQAIGSTRSGKRAGSLSKVGCFSFFPTKNLGGHGDGGMITTNDQELSEKIRRLRSHGESAKRYIHYVIGTNSRLDELQAAVLRVKLKYLDQWNAKRAEHAAFYLRELKNMPLELPVIEEANRSNFHQFVVRTEARDNLKEELARKEIGTAIYYPVPLPSQPCFSYLGHHAGDFPVAEKAATKALALPVYPELTAEQIGYVVSTIRAFFGRSV